MNSVLESLAKGVPVVAIPFNHVVPGVAARVQRAGVGEVIPLQQLSSARLRKALSAVLRDPAYRAAAQQIKATIERTDALDLAADIVEETFWKSRSVASYRGEAADGYAY